MLKRLATLGILLIASCPFFGQATTGYHRISQVLQRAPQGGVDAQVVPYASVYVTSASTGLAATIYSDPLLTSPIANSTVTTDENGNYGYYIPLGQCETETITYPGGGSITNTNVCTLISGTVTGQANGVIPLATGVSTIGAQSHLSDNGSLVTSSIPVSVTGTVTASGTVSGSNITSGGHASDDLSLTTATLQTMAGPLDGVATTMTSSVIPANGVSPFNFTFNNPDTTNAHYRGVAATCNVVNPGGACYGTLIQENDNSNDSLKAHNVGLNVGIVNPNTSSSSNGTDEFGIAVTTNLGPLGTDSYWSGSGVRIEGTTPVQYGFNTTDGAAYIGLDLGALTATGTSQSQYLLMHGISAGSDSSNFALWSDANGNGFIEPSGFNTSLTLQGTSVPSGVTNSYLLLQPNGQYVGVGTVSPFYQFDVLGTSAARTLVAYDSVAPTVSWIAGAGGATKWSMYSGVTDPASLLLKDTSNAVIANFSPAASGGVYQIGGTSATYSAYGSVYEAPNTNIPYVGLEAWGGGGGTDFRQFRLSSNSVPTLNFQYGVGTANGQTFSTLATLDQYGNFKAKHHIASGTPTIACGTGAGTSPTVCTITGNDEAGIISVTTGTSPASNAAIFTATLGNPCPTTVYPETKSGNANAASLTGNTHDFVNASTLTANTWQQYSNATGLSASTAYVWIYTARCN